MVDDNLRNITRATFVLKLKIARNSFKICSDHEMTRKVIRRRIDSLTTSVEKNLRACLSRKSLSADLVFSSPPARCIPSSENFVVEKKTNKDKGINQRPRQSTPSLTDRWIHVEKKSNFSCLFPFQRCPSNLMDFITWNHCFSSLSSSLVT